MALTAKQEVFCQKVAIQKLTQTDAYSAAYDVEKMAPDTIRKKASELALSGDVAARIAVLSERATAAALKKSGLTLEASMKELDDLMQDAQALGQISAGVAAAKVRAQLAGHLVEKKEIRSGPLEASDVEALLKMQRQIDADAQRARDAAELAGEAEVVVIQPVRRAIG